MSNLRIESDHEHGNRVVYKDRVLGYFHKLDSPDPDDVSYACFECRYHQGRPGKASYIGFANDTDGAKKMITDTAFVH